MSKRGRDGSTIIDSRKRIRQTPTLKRSADFDCEMEHIHKRLKATTPTAEEAMAFLLPHLLKFRKLYMEIVKENEILKEHNQVLTTAYSKMALNSSRETNRLKRELEMTKYRVCLMQNH